MLETRARDREPFRRVPATGTRPARRARWTERTTPHVTFPEIDAAAQTPAGQTRLKRQLAEHAIAQATAAAVGGRGRDQPPPARARCGLRGREPARQGAVGARRARLRPRALPEGPRARPDQPHRRAQHRPPQGPARRGRREDRPGQGGLEGAGEHLRRGDRQDRLRAPHEPRPLGRARPGQPGRRGGADPRGQPPDRDQQRRSGSASWSRGSPPACSSSWPTATSTSPA